MNAALKKLLYPEGKKLNQMDNRILAQVAALYFFGIFWSPNGGAIDLDVVTRKCMDMNQYALADYEKSLLHQPINGTATLKSIDANYGNPGSPLEKAMNFLHVEPTYSLHFQTYLQEISVNGFKKKDVIALKTGMSYQYSASRITKIKISSKSASPQCWLRVEAEK